MALRPGHCPADRDEAAEAYVADNLLMADRAALEEHMLIWAGCRMAVEDAGKYGKALRQAKRRLRTEQGRSG
jgi:hypothetical protein